MLLGHVCHALGVQVLDQGFHSSTKGMLPMLYAVLFQPPQHAIDIGCAPHTHGSFGQCMHGGERACEPVVVGEIETVASGLERSMMHAILSPALTTPPVGWHSACRRIDHNQRGTCRFT